jgi:hypothetical protein
VVMKKHTPFEPSLALALVLFLWIVVALVLAPNVGIWLTIGLYPLAFILIVRWHGGSLCH